MRSGIQRLTASRRLTLPADALLLTVVAGAVLVIAKDFLALPHSWLDSMDAFHVTMALASIAGATGAWLIHRRKSGLRSLTATALGLTVAVAAVLFAESALFPSGDDAAMTATLVLTVCQSVGAAAVIGMLAASVFDLVRTSDRKRRIVAIVRVAGLATIAALIVFCFIPETQADAQAAHLYAVLGLTTVTGAAGVALGDVLLAIFDRRDPMRTD